MIRGMIEISENKVMEMYEEYCLELSFFENRPDFWDYVERMVEQDELYYDADTGKFYRG